MALVLANRVQESGTANTTVSFTLTGAVSGFQTFAAIGNTNTTYYTATDASGNWEVGLGTYSTTGPTLTRTTVYASSNSGSAVTFSGAVNVFVTYPSGRSVNLDSSGNVSALGTVASGTWQGTTVGVAYGGTGVTTSSGANSVMLRDSNQNVAVNRLNQSNTSTAAAAGTTTLTAASSYSQTLTGTGNQTYKMPDATTLTTGVAFVFNNNATGTLTLQDYAAGSIGTITAGGAAELVLLANGTTAGTWDVHSYIPENVTWGTNALALGSTVITGGTWNGGTIPTGYGGTGLTTFTGANNALYSTSASALAAGTLPVAAGGTGLTSYTANGVVYASSSSALATGSALVFDGTNLAIGQTTANINGGAVNLALGSTSTAGILQLLSSSAQASWVQFGNSTTGTGRYAGAVGYDQSVNALLFYSSSAEKMRLDSSGNLGLGVTPSAWNSASKAIQFANGSIYSRNLGTATIVANNVYFDSGGGNTYVNTGTAADYVQTAGQHLWRTAASGTGGTSISFTQAMTLDASGNLGIGTSSPTSLSGFTALTVNAAGSGNSLFELAKGGTIYGRFTGSTSGTTIAAGGFLVFSTGSSIGAESERMRITSAGGISFGSSGTAYGTSGQVLTSAGNAAPTWTTATNANTASAIVQRDASGNFSAGTITATLSGSATQVSNSLTLATSGTGLSGSATFNGASAQTFTVTSNATNANTASTIVARDASGNFSAGTITATLSGNATNVTGTVAIANGGTGATTLAGASIVTYTGSETLTNKTLTNPTVNNYTEGVVAIGNSGTTQTLSLTNGTFQTVTLTGNCTFTMPTNTAGKSFILIAVQDATGSRTATFTSVKWPGGTAPTMTTTASTGRDIFTFIADGTNWYGTVAQAFA